MKKFDLIILLIANWIRFSRQNELSVAIDLIQQFHSRHCFFVQNIEKVDRELILSFKKFSSQNIACANLNYYDFIRYVRELRYLNYKIGFIFKEKNLATLELMYMKYFDKNGQMIVLSGFIWIIFVQAPVLDLSRNKLMVSYNTEFIIVQKTNDSFYKLTELYTFKNNTFTFDFGEWDRYSGLKVPDISLPARRLNLNGSTLNILVVIDVIEPNFCDEYPSASKCQIYNVIKDLSRAMNFKLFMPMYNLEAITDAIIQELDLSLFGQLWNSDYLKLKQVAYPIFKQSFNWYIKFPETILRPDYFLQPFHINLWLAIISSILLGSMLMLLLHNLTVPTDQRLLVDRMFFIFESFCNQCGNDEIDGISFRIVCLLSRMMAIIITTFFGAVITSYLAVEIPQIPFTNEKEFVENGQFKLIMDDSEYIKTLLFKGSINYNTTIIYDLENFINNIEKIVCGPDNVAVPYPDHKINKRIQKCHIHRILNPLLLLHESLDFFSFSPIMYLINFNVIRLYESGIQKKMQEYRSELPFTTDEAENVSKPVKIEQMILVLCLPLLGTLISALILFGEMLMFNRKSRHRVFKMKTKSSQCFEWNN